MTLGEKIRQTRLEKGFSQENMADILHISTTAYGDIERNKTELTIKRAKELAEILSVSFLELLGLEVNELNHKAEKLQLENEKLTLEVEKMALETRYWREKAEHHLFEERIFTEVHQFAENRHKQRKQIGF